MLQGDAKDCGVLLGQPRSIDGPADHRIKAPPLWQIPFLSHIMAFQNRTRLKAG